MKRYREEPVPATTRRLIEATICDLCQRPITRESRFSRDEAEVKLTLGESYPEGGSGTAIEYDVCVPCFRSKVIPFMESQGAQTVETDWDW